MGKYFLKRLLFSVITLVALATITFFLFHVIPDSPFAGDESNLSDNLKEELTEHYRMDEPIHIQYVQFLGNIIRGDFGPSLTHRGREVSDVIKMEISNTVSLGAVAFCIAIGVGILLGTIAAFSKHRWVNHAVTFVATIGVSVPSFLLALLMMLLFGVVLGWLPIVGLISWRHYIMPGIALALAPIAMISRLTKNSLKEVMQQDYMVMARSKGTGQTNIIIRHALKNALIPVVTYAGPLLATLLTGSFIIETLFSISGIGAEFVMSVVNHDYTMLMALIMLCGTFVIISNMVTDLITAVLDPRIRLK